MFQIKEVYTLTREYRDIAGAGGLKDVAQELSEALVRKGIKVTVFMPRYGFLDPEKLGFWQTGVSFSVDMDYAHEERREEISLWQGELNGVRIFLIEADRYAEKLGIYTYTEEEEKREPWKKKGTGHFDYFAMNILLQKTALCTAIYLEEKPEIIHCHDGHTACTPALAREIMGFRHYFPYSGFLITIHNAGLGYHQDVADLPFAKANTGLPWRVINDSLLNGSFNPFLCGSKYAVINTVSEQYAKELQETDLDAHTGWLGHALKERGIKLYGITNGITPEDFDPRKPEKLGLPAGFDPLKGDFAGKKVCRQELLRKIKERDLRVKAFGSPEDREGWPLLTAISRLTEQKGINILAQTLRMLYEQGEEFLTVILGTGTPEIEESLMAIARDFPDRMALLLGYDPKLANLIYAAGDFFVIPSNYEPCGLTDFMAQLMGNLPIVRHTGGLVKVKDGFNGFVYVEQKPEELAGAILRAFEVYRKDPARIKQMIKQAIEHIYENYTWDKVSEKYLELYRKALNLRPISKD
ncbi:Starch synthase catalytic domain-containing protein [Thermodesulfatator indicus DSM 15286]|uniref:starch synthase n=1 Tax=Thermodesulfatator indicus (strain DSM 15286 / JCM 11887 / CIR29812) TaxID=667014 RepID=F8A919_THEID|nr:glycogen/starch synthase [Thermodesulfatator indicus]AEH45147.1 Starch synthase catalytic domain-containing protein [Thermodesulfatator indicus DSM 15286]